MLVLKPVEVGLHNAISRGRDHDHGAGLPDRLDQRIGIERLIGYHSLGLDAFQQYRRLRQLMHLPNRQLPARQIVQPLDQAVNLGGQSATRALDCRFLGAPAACWCALKRVETRKNSSRSAFLANSVNKRCQTPRSDLHAKRSRACPSTETRRNIPSRRTGQAIHRMASTKKRLSLAVIPTSVALPGNIPSMRAYLSSRRICRALLKLHQFSWNSSLNVTVNRTLVNGSK